jgi:hypothetical protein
MLDNACYAMWLVLMGNNSYRKIALGKWNWSGTKRNAWFHSISIPPSISNQLYIIFAFRTSTPITTNINLMISSLFMIARTMKFPLRSHLRRRRLLSIENLTSNHSKIHQFRQLTLMKYNRPFLRSLLINATNSNVMKIPPPRGRAVTATDGSALAQVEIALRRQ